MSKQILRNNQCRIHTWSRLKPHKICEQLKKNKTLGNKDFDKPMERVSLSFLEIVCAFAIQVANGALQLYGGYGYLKDYPIERIVRDLRVHSVTPFTAAHTIKFF